MQMQQYHQSSLMRTSLAKPMPTPSRMRPMMSMAQFMAAACNTAPTRKAAPPHTMTPRRPSPPPCLCISLRLVRARTTVPVPTQTCLSPHSIYSRLLRTHMHTVTQVARCSAQYKWSDIAQHGTRPPNAQCLEGSLAGAHLQKHRPKTWRKSTGWRGRCCMNSMRWCRHVARDQGRITATTKLWNFTSLYIKFSRAVLPHVQTKNPVR